MRPARARGQLEQEELSAGRPVVARAPGMAQVAVRVKVQAGAQLMKEVEWD